MKKLLLLTCAAVSCCSANAQNQLDKYTTGTNTFTEIGGSAQGISNPQDLDFVPGRPSECWVLNKEANGGSVVLFFNTGKSNL